MSIQDRRNFLQKQLEKYNIVSTTDSVGNIIYVNDKFCEVAKYSREELIGKNNRMLKSGIHPDAVFTDMWDTISKGDVWRGDVCNKAKNGTLYWGDSLIIPELDKAGKPAFYHVFKTLITRRKKAEEELQKTKDNLEEQLAEQQVINKILALSSASNSLPKFFNSCLNLLATVPNLSVLPHLGVYILDKETNDLMLIAGKNIDLKIIDLDNLKLNEISALTAKTKKTQCCQFDINKRTQPSHKNEPHSHCSVPMLFNNELVGVLEIYFEYTRKNTKREVQFLESIATLLANKTQMVTSAQKLNDNELKYRRLYDTTPAMYFSLNSKGSIIEVNSFGAKSLGYKKEELENKSVSVLFPSKFHKPVQEQIKTCLKHPTKTHEWEIQKVQKDGTPMTVKETAWVEYDLNGLPFLRLICEDITEQKIAELAIKAERNLLVDGPTVVFQWSGFKNFSLKYVSPNAESIFGYSAEDFNTQKINYLNIIHPLDYQRVINELREHKNGVSNKFVQEYQIVHAKGNIRWVRAMVQITRNDSGNAVLFNGHVYDVTEQHQAQKETKLAKERLISLIEAIPDAIFLKDGKGRWLITNIAAKKLYNLDKIDWHTKTDQELGELRPEYMDAHQDCMISDEEAWQAKKLTLSTEYALNELDETREFSVRKMPLFNEDGSRLALVIVGSDVTERKQKETEISIKSEKLEQVAWMFSHEVRAPVATIMGLANIFNFDNYTDPINADVLKRIRKPIDSLHSTISYIVKETNELDK